MVRILGNFQMQGLSVKHIYFSCKTEIKINSYLHERRTGVEDSVIK